MSNLETRMFREMMEEQHTEAIIDRDFFWQADHICQLKPSYIQAIPEWAKMTLGTLEEESSFG
ncbi:MAG: hypothetical protein F4082_07195 [Gammaproteobacteria bacterium]|nr:hypothetical protein [Gammaproteobacteria bacterium]